jgi:hypothetical protein
MDTLVRGSPVTPRAPLLTNATASHVWLDRAEFRARTVRTRPLVPRIALAASLGFLAGERDRAGDAARDARRAPGSRARCSPNSRHAIETASRCRREAHARARRDSGSRRRLIARRPRAFPSRRTTRTTTKTYAWGLRVGRARHVECDRNASAKNPGFLPYFFFFTTPAAPRLTASSHPHSFPPLCDKTKSKIRRTPPVV